MFLDKVEYFNNGPLKTDRLLINLQTSARRRMAFMFDLTN